MSILLILFFASLLGIAVMIGKKLFLLKEEPAITEENFLIRTPDMREIRYVFVRKSREYGFIVLVEIIRFSVRSSKLLKRTYKEAENKIRKITSKYIKHKETVKEKEVSGFLKKISEYKQKVRKIADQVIEEEKEN